MTQQPDEEDPLSRRAREGIKEWPQDWPRWVTMLVATQIKSVRGWRNMSAQQLADRCAQLGMPIARSVLANLESGRRTSITLPEILILARALGVSPLTLCIPVGAVDTYLPTPGEQLDPWDAAKWFTGEAPFPGEVPGALPPSMAKNVGAADKEYAQRFNDMSGIFRHHDAYAYQVLKARDGLLKDQEDVATQAQLGADNPLGERLLEASAENLARAEERLLELRRILRSSGLEVLPPLGEALAYLEEREGFTTSTDTPETE